MLKRHTENCCDPQKIQTNKIYYSIWMIQLYIFTAVLQINVISQKSVDSYKYTQAHNEIIRVQEGKINELKGL